MALKQTQKETVRRLVHDLSNIDSALPVWARRSNPIVRRELGEHWRVFPPELRPILFWVALQTAVMALSVYLPIIFIPVIISVLVAALMFPFLLYNYALSLIALVNEAAYNMVREYQHNTIHLLRVTPYTPRQIILSKIAAAVWRQMDIFVILTLFTVTFGMPIIVVVYLNLYPPEDYPFLAQGLSVLALMTHLIRVPLELFMAASIAVLMGTTIRFRQGAFLASIAVLVFYFVMLNMLRFIPVTWPVRFMLDAVLPMLLPIVIVWLCIRQAVRNL